MSNSRGTKPSGSPSAIRWVDETASIVKSANQSKYSQDSSKDPFIHETGRTRPITAQSRQLIHSYASRHRPRKGKTKVKKSDTGNDLARKVDVQNDLDCKVLARASSRPTKDDVKPPVSIRLDPFHTSRVPSNQETDLVLHHWISVVERVGREPLSPEFWPFVATSPALLFATMSISALDLHNAELKTFRQPSYAYLCYKYFAIREVNKNMQISSEQLSDGTVCAVAMLALSDLALNMHPTFENHVNGLGIIIDQRGGFNTIQGLTRQIVMWVVSVAAANQQKLPRFYIASDVLTPEERHAMEISKKFIRNYLAAILPSNLESSVMEVYAELSILTHVLDESDNHKNDKPDVSLPEKCVHLESLTLALIDQLDSTRNFEGRDVLLAFAIAAMLYEVRSTPLSQPFEDFTFNTGSFGNFLSTRY